MITKDSGKRRNYHTGAVRDRSEGKPSILGSHHFINIIADYISGAKFSPTTHKDAPYDLPVQEGHPLITPQLLDRVQALLERGAAKYGEGNWQKGMPLHDTYDSLIRHALYAWMGDNTEDHLAAIVANVMFIMHTEQKLVNSDYPSFIASYLADAGLPLALREKYGNTTDTE